MINPIERICDNIAGDLWATYGLEEGVQEQTIEALGIAQEIIHDLPNMDNIAVAPVGSRFKGYASLDSDLDIVMVSYDEKTTPLEARQAIGKVVTERLGIAVCRPSIPDLADETLTIGLVDHGTYTSFPARKIVYGFAKVLFEGPKVAERKRHMFRELTDESGRFFQSADEQHSYYVSAENAYHTHFIYPKFGARGVARRYIKLLGIKSKEKLVEFEQHFDDAYRNRAQAYQVNIRNQVQHAAKK